MPPKFKLIFGIAAVLLLFAFAFSERSYDDCILHNVKQGMGREAVILISNACRSKHP